MSGSNNAEMRLLIAAKFMSRTLTQPEDSRSAAVDVRNWTEADLRDVAAAALNAADVLIAMSAEVTP